MRTLMDGIEGDLASVRAIPRVEVAPLLAPLFAVEVVGGLLRLVVEADETLVV